MAVTPPVVPPTAALLRFGLFELDAERWELRRQGVLIHLQQQPCRLLHLLASNPQIVIDREDIRRLLWPGEISGDFGTRINYCIACIRDALGDDADNPLFIKTVRGQGYCFLAPRIEAAPAAPAPPPRGGRFAVAAAAAVCLALSLALAWLLWPRPSVPPNIFRLVHAGTLAVTHGKTDVTLVAAGGYAYYSGTTVAGNHALFRVPLAGGAPVPIVSDLSWPILLAASPDGRALVVAQGAFANPTSPDWLAPSSGGHARRFGQVYGPYVAWRPDGIAVAFGGQDSAWLADAQGEHARRLASVPGSVVTALGWSPDGRTLAFTATDEAKDAVTVWLLPAAGGPPQRLATVADAGPVSELVWLRDGRHILASVGRRAYNDSVLFAFTLPSGRGSVEAPLVLGDGNRDGLSGPALDAHGRLLLGNERAAGDEVLRWDAARGSFEPFLHDARDAAFSPDRARIAYVRPSDNSLWLARADGSSARQLAGHPLRAMLPRWSPDGTRIAFSAVSPQGNWRLYLIAADGPATPQPLPDPDPANGQGAPTWMPSGGELIYANVLCTVPASCGVHRLNLRTGTDTLLPGSEGLRTARLSPDGRWVAALRVSDQEVMLGDLARPAAGWRTLWPHSVTDNLAWSADSRSVYAVAVTPTTAVIDILPIDGSPARPAARLSIPDPDDVQPISWFDLAPGDSPMLSLNRSALEIEALTLELIQQHK